MQKIPCLDYERGDPALRGTQDRLFRFLRTEGTLAGRGHTAMNHKYFDFLCGDNSYYTLTLLFLQRWHAGLGFPVFGIALWGVWAEKLD